MWQKAVAPHVKAGRLVAIGVVQEQHPDRARLYRQWRKLDWPIFVDALNLLGHKVVPIPMAIDESGVIRHRKLSPRDLESKFLNVEYPKARPGPPAEKRSLDKADQLYLFGDDMDAAVTAYETAVKRNRRDGKAHFKLGVALRRRYESKQRRPEDAQRAVKEWGEALAIDPNHYIWRRRIQQYGPRLDKPYNFYFWVDEARKEIRARGETPVPLVSEPTGSEIAPPAKGRAQSGEVPDPDPKGRINRDPGRFVSIEPAVTPARVKPGGRVRVRLVFRLNPSSTPWWNNEADPMTVSFEARNGFRMIEGKLIYPEPSEVETQELRIMEFELQVPKSAPAGQVQFPGYALYAVCEDEGGVCRYLRGDFEFGFDVDPTAPSYR